jgi:hypothetical protein
MSARRPLLSGFEKLALFSVVLILGYYAMGRYGKKKPTTFKEKAAYTAETLRDRLKKTKNELREYSENTDKREAAVDARLEQIAQKFSTTGIKKHVRQEETVDNLMDWGLTESEARFYAKLQQQYAPADPSEERSEADWLSILQASSKGYDKIKNTLKSAKIEDSETAENVLSDLNNVAKQLREE